MTSSHLWGEGAQSRLHLQPSPAQLSAHPCVLERALRASHRSSSAPARCWLPLLQPQPAGISAWGTGNEGAAQGVSACISHLALCSPQRLWTHFFTQRCFFPMGKAVFSAGSFG